MLVSPLAASPNLFQKFLLVLGGLAGVPFFAVIFSLAFINVNKADNEAEVALLEQILAVAFIGVPLLILALPVIWQVFEKRAQRAGRPFNNLLLSDLCITLCRYLLAVILMFYGFSKLMVDQLHMSTLWFGDELGDLHGSRLAWSFFGYSAFYNTFIALSQIAGAALLLFRRTTLLGACFLLPILVNITLIDFNYDVDAKDIISALLLMDLFLIGLHLKPLLTFFLSDAPVAARSTAAPAWFSPRTQRVAKGLSLLFVLSFAFLTNYNQMATAKPSVLEGAWEATLLSDSPAGSRTRLKFLVEGGQAVIKKTELHRFYSLQLDAPAKGRSTLEPMRKEDHHPSLAGNYRLLHPDSLLLTGADNKQPFRWVLGRSKRGR